MWVRNLLYHQIRTKRAERVPTLCTDRWTIEVSYEISYCDIVANGVAMYHRERIARPHLAAALPNHHRQFDLVMHILHTRWINNRASMSNPGIRRLKEQCRFFRCRDRQFGGMIGEVQSQANDRVWDNRGQKYFLILAVRLPGFV